MIVLLLIMIWLSMLCNLWLLFRVNMNDEDLNDLTKIVSTLWEDNKENKNKINEIENKKRK